jgi:hypothetical protein
VSEIPWPEPLEERDGAVVGLPGITVFHDFPWEERFPSGVAEFPGSEELAAYVTRLCPEDETPALLLTRRTDARQGHIPHDELFIVSVNVDAYERHAQGGVAATYLIHVSGMRPAVLAGFDWSQVPDTEFRAALDQRLSPESLRHWLAADPSRLESVLGVLGEVAGITATVRGREQEAVDALVELLGDDVWNAIVAAGAEIPEALAQHRTWQARQAAIAEFEAHMKSGDWSEPRWQRFFKENTWIFGFGLRYQFLHELSERPHLGARAYTGRGGQESDYLFATGAARRFTVLVDIKRPDAPLVLDQEYRNRVHKLGEDLVGGVTQVQQQCRQWEVEGSRLDANRELLSSLGAYGHRPEGILVIGNTESLDTQEKLRSFEFFRAGLVAPEVLTFDEMLERGRRFIALSENTEDSE